MATSWLNRLLKMKSWLAFRQGRKKFERNRFLPALECLTERIVPTVANMSLIQGSGQSGNNAIMLNEVQPVTVTLQQGVSGYTGTTDVTLTTQYAQYTDGNGITSFTSPQIGLYQTAGADGYSAEDMVRFSNLGVPTGATISSATLTLNVYSWTNNPTIRGYYVQAPWNGTPGSNTSQVGWLHRGTGQDWASPGALGQGTDVIAGKNFVVPGITASGTQTITVNLDPAVVQNWVNNPGSNQGIHLVNETTGAVVWVNTSENATVTTRPKLSVTYATATPQPGTLQFSAAAYTVNENQGTAAITVTRTAGSSGAVSVNYATSNGTATAGSDYTSSSGTLNFAAGEISKTFTVPIINDTAVEPNETVHLTLSSPTGGATLGSQSTATLTIVSDDVAQPGALQFSAATYTVNENQGTATITVSRAGGSNVPVSVNYATSNGTASAGSDYTTSSGTLSFGVGEISKTFTVPIINDTAIESNETVNLTLSSPTGGATLGGQSTATLTIVSDDIAQPGVLQFSAATYTVNENQTTATITVSRTGGSNVPVSVNYATSNGTATAGSDYTAVTGTLSFAEGETSKTFTVPIINDTAVEDNETVNLTLSSPTGGASLGGQATAILTIVSDEVAQPGVVQFSTASYTVNESQGTATITVSRAGGSNVPVSVNYATSNGTASAGSDYTTSSGTLNFGVGEISKTFTVPIINDTAIESDETVNLILSSPTGGATLGGQSTATLTIVSDDVAQPGVVQFSAATYTVNESQGTATITVSRTGGSNVPVSVNYATSNGTATAGTDYTASSGTLNFAAGETTKTFTVPIINDTAVEGNETVNLTLNSPTGGATLGGQVTATLTIVSDEVAQPGVVQFSAATYTVNESQGTVTITVSRTGGSNVPVSVNYATSNGTATAGSDYFASSGTLNFGVGETSKTFTVPIINDIAVEGDETVNLALSSPTGGATLGAQSTAILTIVSDDAAQPGVLQFSAPAYVVNEGQGFVSITVTRTSDSNVPASVNYATSNGSATAGSDYTAVSGTLNFAAGETSKSFTVPIINDSLVEGDETVNLTLSNPTGGATLGSPSTASLTIVSDDVAQSVTVALQQGVSGYAGTTDVSITTQYAQFTGGNGITGFASPQMGLYQIAGTDGYVVKDLVRFSNLGIPTGATVSSATLTLNVDSQSNNPTIRGYYLQAPWNGTPGSDANQVGWLHRGTGQDWASPGALGQGTDVIAGKSFVLQGIIASGSQTITVTLDPAVVQNWINDPGSNQGILLVNETTGAVVRIGASENATVTARPKLSVTYTAVPQPGALQFATSAYTVNENQGTATITVARTGGSSGAVSVNYATSNGSAMAGSDYTATSGTLNFAEGETSKTFTVPIINDTAVEGNETVNLTLSSPTGGATLGTQTMAVLTIHDAATLTSIDVSPVNPTIATGQTIQFTAMGHFSDGSTQTLSSGVTWMSANSSIATISSSGLASAVGTGSVMITAVDGSITSNTTLSVAAQVNPTLGAHTLTFTHFNSPAGTMSTNPITTQASGSTVLAWVGRGDLSTFSSATAPRDNRGNTSTQLGSTHDYAPLFPNSGMALYAFQSFAGGSNDVFSVPKPVPDEVTLAVVEIKNGGVIQDVQWNKVVNDPQTSLSVTTTGPATLITFWTGDGATGAVSAVPNNGFTLLDSELQADDAVQAAVATREVSAAGTYNVTWTAAPAQTAFIWIIAVQHGTPVPHLGMLHLGSSNVSVNENQGMATGNDHTAVVPATSTVAGINGNDVPMLFGGGDKSVAGFAAQVNSMGSKTANDQPVNTGASEMVNAERMANGEKDGMLLDSAEDNLLDETGTGHPRRGVREHQGDPPSELTDQIGGSDPGNLNGSRQGMTGDMTGRK